MSFEFIEDVQKLADVLHEIKKSGYGLIGNSNIYKGCRFWNAAGNERSVNYPTIYWSIELEKQLLAKAQSEEL